MEALALTPAVGNFRAGDLLRRYDWQRRAFALEWVPSKSVSRLYPPSTYKYSIRGDYCNGTRVLLIVEFVRAK